MLRPRNADGVDRRRGGALAGPQARPLILKSTIRQLGIVELGALGIAVG